MNGPDHGTTAPEGFTLAPAEFEAFREFLYERSGLYFAESKKYLLESRVHRRLKALGVGAPAEYLRLLKAPGRGAEELMEFLD
ncbi:MAG: hypothetical protein ACYDA8_14220, partial [Deferrisomatales bacterium]